MAVELSSQMQLQTRQKAQLHREVASVVAMFLEDVAALLDRELQCQKHFCSVLVEAGTVVLHVAGGSGNNERCACISKPRAGASAMTPQ